MEREKSYMELMIEEDIEIGADGYDDFKISKSEVEMLKNIIMGESYIWQDYDELLSEVINNLYDKKMKKKSRKEKIK